LKKTAIDINDIDGLAKKNYVNNDHRWIRDNDNEIYYPLISARDCKMGTNRAK